jgi:hypothetical protein
VSPFLITGSRVNHSSQEAELKISSKSTGGMASMQLTQQAHASLFTTMRHALRTFFMKLGRMQVAIVLSEAGDFEGAKSLLGKRAE